MFRNYIFLICFVEGRQIGLMLRTIEKNSRINALMLINIREHYRTVNIRKIFVIDGRVTSDIGTESLLRAPCNFHQIWISNFPR